MRKSTNFTTNIYLTPDVFRGSGNVPAEDGTITRSGADTEYDEAYSDAALEAAFSRAERIMSAIALAMMGAVAVCNILWYFGFLG